MLLETDHCQFSHIDYCDVTFDHLVAANDPDPEVFAINIIEVDNDGGEYADRGKHANDILLGTRVLAVLRCYRYKKGTQDRRLIHGLVAKRDSE